MSRAWRATAKCRSAKPAWAVGLVRMLPAHQASIYDAENHSTHDGLARKEQRRTDELSFSWGWTGIINNLVLRKVANLPRSVTHLSSRSERPAHGRSENTPLRSTGL